jgi:hypothetical protein
VIVPSYQRRDSLALVLEALRRQDAAAAGRFEVIVVLDGSTDGSVELLEAWERERRLPGMRWVRQANAGQAAARDAGAHMAAAPVLLFVDDDVVAAPDLVCRHLAWHAAGERIAVLGDYETLLDGRPPASSRRSTCSSCVAGGRTCSGGARCPGACPTTVTSARATSRCAATTTWRSAASIRRSADTAARTTTSATGCCVPACASWPTAPRAPITSIGSRCARRCVRRRRRGSPTCTSVASIPSCARRCASCSTPPVGSGRALFRLALTASWADVAIARTGEALLAAAERLRLRGHWRALHHEVRAHAYWCGVRRALGSLEALRAYRREAVLPEQSLELAAGIPPVAALRGFWVHGPSRVQVTWQGDLLFTDEISYAIEESLRPFLAWWVSTRAPALAWLADEEAITPFDHAVATRAPG